MKIFTDEFLKLLEERVKTRGIGFWFEAMDYIRKVESGQMTFNDWVESIVKGQLYKEEIGKPLGGRGAIQ